MNDRAGTPATAADLIDVAELIDAYHHRKPDVTILAQRVAFGTSGHRGSSLDTAFNKDHILAITQAIVDYRTGQGITGPLFIGPLFIGSDTHALSAPAQTTALEVLVGNRVDVLVEQFGNPAYARTDAVATPAQRATLGKLSGASIAATELAGEPITAKLSEAPGNGAAIGGVKVVTENAWFAARPSGTEDVYKIYAESFTGPEHLAEVQLETQHIVDAALGCATESGT